MKIKNALPRTIVISAVALTVFCAGDGGKVKVMGDSMAGNFSVRDAHSADADTAATAPSPPAADTSYTTDPRDGQIYRTVTIGDKLWMAENLSFKTSGSLCYNDADSNCTKYGRLYTWYAAMNACPNGWDVPSNADWEILMNAVGGRHVAAKKLKSKTGWKDGKNGKSGNGTDDYGFSAFPVGTYYSHHHRGFHNIGTNGDWWSSTEVNHENTYSWGMSKDTTRVYSGVHTEKGYGLSVRCVWVGHKVNAGDHEYRSVTIGNHTWMAENLNIETGSSWCYDDADTNCAKYGRLYTWYAAMRACPGGWHLPKKAEWEDLMVAVGGVKSKRHMQKRGEVDIYRGAGKKLKSKSGWDNDRGTNGNGTDNYGFSALPGGRRHDYRGNIGYTGANKSGYFWSSDIGRAYYWGREAFNWNIYYNDGTVTEEDTEATAGFSVRCVQDRSGYAADGL